MQWDKVPSANKSLQVSTNTDFFTPEFLLLSYNVSKIFATKQSVISKQEELLKFFFFFLAFSNFWYSLSYQVSFKKNRKTH